MPGDQSHLKSPHISLFSAFWSSPCPCMHLLMFQQKNVIKREIKIPAQIKQKYKWTQTKNWISVSMTSWAFKGPGHKHHRHGIDETHISYYYNHRRHHHNNRIHKLRARQGRGSHIVCWDERHIGSHRRDIYSQPASILHPPRAVRWMAVHGALWR